MTTAALEKKQTKLTITAAVNHCIQESRAFAREVQTALRKFSSNDWGICSENDKAMNNEDPGSAMGNYPIEHGNGKMLWVKRDDYGDFYQITVLYPSDY